MAAIKKYTADEALSLAVNDGADALKVDLEGANINAVLEVNLDSASDSVALKAAVETDIQLVQEDIALMKADIILMTADLDAIRIAVEATKVTTDKLDACINDVTDRIKVDVEASI